jgi:hypothetical protein
MKIVKLLAAALACVAVLAPGRAFAQGAQLRLDQFDALASRAKEAVNVSLDQSMMQMAGAFLAGAGAGAKKNADAVKGIADLVAGLKGVYVRNFSFEKDGAYSSKDLDAVRAQLKAPWTSIVNTREEHETVDVYTWPENGQIGGLAVVVTEPKEVTIVNLVGKIDMAKLSALGGTFGIPQNLPIPGLNDKK